MIVIDNSIISSLAKIDRLNLLKSIFKNETIVIVSEVVNELLASKEKGYIFLKRILDIIALRESGLNDKKWILQKYSNEEISLLINQLYKKYPNIHLGETASIAFAKKNNAILLIDDRRALCVANKEKIETYTLPALIQYCKIVNILDVSEIKEIIRLLELKDHYKFQEEIKKELLTE